MPGIHPSGDMEQYLCATLRKQSSAAVQYSSSNRNAKAVISHIAAPAYATRRSASGCRVLHENACKGSPTSIPRGRCRTVRARCAHGACTVRARFNVFGMVAQLVPR